MSKIQPLNDTNRMWQLNLNWGGLKFAYKKTQKWLWPLYDILCTHAFFCLGIRGLDLLHYSTDKPHINPKWSFQRPCPTTKHNNHKMTSSKCVHNFVFTKIITSILYLSKNNYPHNLDHRTFSQINILYMNPTYRNTMEISLRPYKSCLRTGLFIDHLCLHRTVL